jgi:sugar O-acyltransferase (sialic acid O-acetyltransferase NeuD family)
VVIIVGTQNIAKIAIEIFQQNDLLVYGLLTEEKEDKRQEISHIPILGYIDDEKYISLLGKNCQIFVALEQINFKKRVIQQLAQHEHIVFMSAIHPLAHLSTSVTMGYGNFIHMGTMLGPEVVVGNHCLLHQQVAIEQEVIIKDHVQIGAGSVIGKQTVIEENVFVGAGATLVAGIHIGAGARIGAGSVVLASVPADTTVLGNPAAPLAKS